MDYNNVYVDIFRVLNTVFADIHNFNCKEFLK